MLLLIQNRADSRIRHRRRSVYRDIFLRRIGRAENHIIRFLPKRLRRRNRLQHTHHPSRHSIIFSIFRKSPFSKLVISGKSFSMASV